MRGLPRNLNSKFDYEFIKNNTEPEYWKPLWHGLLDSLYVWKIEKELNSETEGKEDSTHRIAKYLDEINSTEENKIYKYYQEVKVKNELSDLVRFGFTEKEIKETLSEN